MFLLGLQNKLSVDEFKEERMTEKLKAASLETIKKINSLKDEIDLIRQKSSESPESNEIIESEIKSLEKELIGNIFTIQCCSGYWVTFWARIFGKVT